MILMRSEIGTILFDKLQRTGVIWPRGLSDCAEGAWRDWPEQQEGDPAFGPEDSQTVLRAAGGTGLNCRKETLHFSF
jgi:hypothetical protein